MNKTLCASHMLAPTYEPRYSCQDLQGTRDLGGEHRAKGAHEASRCEGKGCHVLPTNAVLEKSAAVAMASGCLWLFLFFLEEHLLGVLCSFKAGNFIQCGWNRQNFQL